jgi:hypothetical protein
VPAPRSRARSAAWPRPEDPDDGWIAYFVHELCTKGGQQPVEGIAIVRHWQVRGRLQSPGALSDTRNEYFLLVSHKRVMRESLQPGPIATS